MSYTSINGVTNPRGLVSYVFFGLGKEATQRKQNHETRAVAFFGDLPIEDFLKKADYLQKQRGQKCGAISIIQSFDNECDHLDPNSDDDWQYVNDQGYALASKLYPHSPCLVVTHNDGQGGKLHNHIIVLNYDYQTGMAIRGNRQIYRVREVNDELMRSAGLDVIKVQDDFEKQSVITKQNLKDHGEEWCDKYDFDTLLQESISKAYARKPKNRDQMIKYLADESVKVDLKPYIDHDHKQQMGVVYHMLDRYGTGTQSKSKRRKDARWRRRKASRLGKKYKLDYWEELFKEAEKVVKKAQKAVKKTVRKKTLSVDEAWVDYNPLHPGVYYHEFKEQYLKEHPELNDSNPVADSEADTAKKPITTPDTEKVAQKPDIGVSAGDEKEDTEKIEREAEEKRQKEFEERKKEVWDRCYHRIVDAYGSDTYMIANEGFNDAVNRLQQAGGSIEDLDFTVKDFEDWFRNKHDYYKHINDETNEFRAKKGEPPIELLKLHDEVEPTQPTKAQATEPEKPKAQPTKPEKPEVQPTEPAKKPKVKDNGIVLPKIDIEKENPALARNTAKAEANKKKKKQDSNDGDSSPSNR